MPQWREIAEQLNQLDKETKSDMRTIYREVAKLINSEPSGMAVIRQPITEGKTLLHIAVIFGWTSLAKKLMKVKETLSCVKAYLQTFLMIFSNSKLTKLNTQAKQIIMTLGGVHGVWQVQTGILSVACFVVNVCTRSGGIYTVCISKNLPTVF